jgi:hypothetical protein
VKRNSESNAVELEFVSSDYLPSTFQYPENVLQPGKLGVWRHTQGAKKAPRQRPEAKKLKTSEAHKTSGYKHPIGMLVAEIADDKDRVDKKGRVTMDLVTLTIASPVADGLSLSYRRIADMGMCKIKRCAAQWPVRFPRLSRTQPNDLF